MRYEEWGKEIEEEGGGEVHYPPDDPIALVSDASLTRSSVLITHPRRHTIGIAHPINLLFTLPVVVIHGN